MVHISVELELISEIERNCGWEIIVECIICYFLNQVGARFEVFQRNLEFRMVQMSFSNATNFFNVMQLLASSGCFPVFF